MKWVKMVNGPCGHRLAGVPMPSHRWVQLLLSNTRAYTTVIGHVSKAQGWQAGVHRSCLLPPLHYLFVTEALACWLRQCPELGVQVADQKHVGLHHADNSNTVRSLQGTQAHNTTKGALACTSRSHAIDSQALKATSVAAGPPSPVPDWVG
jgi:hypothetical protein